MGYHTLEGTAQGSVCREDAASAFWEEPRTRNKRTTEEKHSMFQASE